MKKGPNGKIKEEGRNSREKRLRLIYTILSNTILSNVVVVRLNAYVDSKWMVCNLKQLKWCVQRVFMPFGNNNNNNSSTIITTMIMMTMIPNAECNSTLLAKYDPISNMLIVLNSIWISGKTMFITRVEREREDFKIFIIKHSKFKSKRKCKNRTESFYHLACHRWLSLMGPSKCSKYSAN